jgi:hypothetical protein
MKPPKIESVLSLAGSLFLLISILRKPLGLPEAFDWSAPLLAIVCFTPLIALRRRQRNARLAAGLPPTAKPPTKRSFWLALLLIIATSVSGPLWLPYTGVTLPASTLVITSVISGVLAMAIFAFSWRYWNKKV